MYRTERGISRFDVEVDSDREEYGEMLNDPFFTVVETIKEKLTTKQFNDEGRLMSQDDRLVLVVIWEKKVLL